MDLLPEAIQSIKIGRGTAWNDSSNANGKNAAANFISCMTGSLTLYFDLAPFSRYSFGERA